MNEELPRLERKRARLPDYDYSHGGYYFVTVCTARHQQILWRRGEQCAPAPSRLSDAGLLVDQAICSIHDHYETVHVEKYVVMPNHIHLILSLTQNEGRTLCAPTISRVVKQLKEYVTKQLGAPIWQKGFYDHIIRNEADYLRVWDYIDQNPAKWAEDEYFFTPRKPVKPKGEP